MKTGSKLFSLGLRVLLVFCLSYASTAQAAIVRDKLRAVWDFDENPSYGVARDRVAGLKLECRRCPSSTGGVIDRAFAFSPGRFFQLNNTSRFNVGRHRGFSFGGFVRLDASCTGESGFYARKAGGKGKLRWALGCRNNRLMGLLTDTAGKSTGRFSGGPSLSVGRWYHVALVFDGTFREVRLYLDGKVVLSRSTRFTAGFSDSAAPLLIGQADFGSGLKGFNGRLDSFTVYNRTLRDEEVRRHTLAKSTGLKKDLEYCRRPTRIMPVGDSITAATNGDGSKTFGNYRKALYGMLQRHGYRIDFVGSQRSRFSEPDPHHEGYPGYRTWQVSKIIQAVLKKNPPDAALIHLGTNGLQFNGMKRTLDNMVSTYRNLPIVVAQIIDRRPHHQGTSAYNDQLGSDVKKRIGRGQRFHLVDMEKILDADRDMFDSLHPNPGGADKMAVVWFESLSAFLPRCQAGKPALFPSSQLSARHGRQFTFVPEALGNPYGTFSLPSKPSGMRINPQTGEVRWKPGRTGRYTFKVQMKNPYGRVVTTYTVRVRS